MSSPGWPFSISSICGSAPDLLVGVGCSYVCIGSLDRGSIGNAKLYNLEKDLHIIDSQYLIALTVFFFPYSLFEVIVSFVAYNPLLI
jgi:hypothetical protein